jgi:hypothetical protein
MGALNRSLPETRESQEVAGITIHCEARFPNTRVLAWDRDVLYASRGYCLFRCRPAEPHLAWQKVASYSPVWWRKLTSRTRLGYRLTREGFHALAILPNGTMVAALPGAIATLRSGDRRFRITHVLQRGTRPLNIAVGPDGRVYWGEYFDNAARDAVHIYGSDENGDNWRVAYSFQAGQIRHVHNVVYDSVQKCFWILTGDIEEECRILRASSDWTAVQAVVAGNQQARAVAAIPREDGLYFASDTPLEQNHIYRLDSLGRIERLADISGSVLCGCSAGGGMFFTTMVEPSAVNVDRSVRVYGGEPDEKWVDLQSWQKDWWPQKLFQYGNAFVASGNNTTDWLAITTIGVKGADLEASLWRVKTALPSRH